MITGIKNDQLFKAFFAQEKFLKYFVNSFFEYLNIPVSFKKVMVIPQAYILENKKNDKAFFGDIVVLSDKLEFLMLEMYNHFSKEEYNKSYAYASRIFSRQIKKVKKKEYHVEKYKDMHPIYNINIIANKYYPSKNKELVNIYINKNKETNEELNSNIITYIVVLDRLKSIAYNINENKFITILRIINAKDLKEVKRYIRKDEEVMEEMVDFLEEWNKNNAKNGFEEYMGEKLYEAESIGIKKGKKEGKKEGKSLGKVEEKRNIAKNLINQNISIDIITKVTGLSKKEILAL